MKLAEIKLVGESEFILKPEDVIKYENYTLEKICLELTKGIKEEILKIQDPD